MNKSEAKKTTKIPTIHVAARRKHREGTEPALGDSFRAAQPGKGKPPPNNKIIMSFSTDDKAMKLVYCC